MAALKCEPGVHQRSSSESQSNNQTQIYRRVPRAAVHKKLKILSNKSFTAILGVFRYTRKFAMKLLVLLVLLLSSIQSASASAEGLLVKSVKGASGTPYHIYEKNDLRIGWETKRPDKSNKKIKLCIPAAFTSTTGTVVGVYAYKGKVSNANRVSKPIGGAIQISGGKFKIFPSSNGAVFTKDFLASVEKSGSSLFQQFQLVEKGIPAKFKDKKIFQMRAIAKFKDDREAIVESVDAINFKQFNSDLASMGVEDALYTDMGAWDEGWYRDPKTSAIVPMGNDRSLTHKQTNWVVFTGRK